MMKSILVFAMLFEIIASNTNVLASPVMFRNSTATSITYEVEIDLFDDAGKEAGSIEDTFVLSGNNNSTRIYGGKTGTGISKGKWAKKIKATKTKNGKTASLFIPDVIGPIQTVAILEDPTNNSDIFAFADLQVANAVQLLSTVEFEFDGFDLGNAPILRQVGTGVRITATTGELFSQFQYLGPTQQVGTVSNFISEPSTIALMGLGLVGLLGFGRRQRRY